MDEAGGGYSALLRKAITDAGTSRRALAPLLAAETGNKVATEYRAIGKYLNEALEPEPDRAAILAVLLSEPRLALVSPNGERRRGRQAELEERVAQLGAAEDRLLAVIDALATRVEALERLAEPRRGQGGR